MITLGIVICSTALVFTLCRVKTYRSILRETSIVINVCLIIAFTCIFVYVSYLITDNTKYQDNMNNCYQNICYLKEQYENCRGLDEDSYRFAVNAVVRQALMYTGQLYKDDKYKRLINPFHKGEHELFDEYMDDVKYQYYNIIQSFESEET